MPLNIPDQLPAIELLRKENIFVFDQTQASHQDIRPLKIAILNLMPLKISSETDLLRLLSNSPLQIEIDFLKIKNHQYKNSSDKHMRQFYKDFEKVKDHRYDGMIITGAPVEKIKFEEVTYWPEIQKIMDWSVNHVTSSMFICWASQAALYHFYGIPKYSLSQKLFGIYKHRISDNKLPIFRGFDDEYYVPHSRYTEVRKDDILKVPELELISYSEIAGVNMVLGKNGHQIFINGHSEYSRDTLKNEYERDLKKHLPIAMPEHYFPDNNPSKQPVMTWKSAANLLFSNWLNYYVYQRTPYYLDE